jgi:EAL domain-containing protein (putative c-di-GMP-specific phosphodiesterase class I)/DNA-binding NarL/FixJ family response regulator
MSRSPRAADDDGPSTKEPDMDRIRVLIADDEEEVLRSLASVIGADPGLEVVGTATDAQVAIEIASSKRPDVALVDVRMPGGGGPRAAREISRRCPPTRVVAISATEDRHSVLTMIRAGATGYLGKGASPDEIVRAIHGTAWGTTALTQNAMNEVFHAYAEALEDDRRRPAPSQRDRIQRIIRRRAVDVAFQPIAELDTLRVVGVEAFARFRTLPRRPPHVWFQEAAGLGLARELELVAAASQLAEARGLPEGIYAAVNVTAETVRSPEFLDLVLAERGDRLVIELSERGPLDDYGPILDALGEVRERGVRLCVDDAGTDSSSLRHTVRLAPDLMKLDMSITRDVASDPARQVWVSSLLAFAADLGVGVVAKGVENARELQALRRLGVRHAQGYHLAHPSRMPATAGPWGRTTFGPIDPS